MKRLIALILTILITAALCSCDLFSVGNILRRFTGETRPVYTDMPLSGGGVEPGFHEDENGFLILNRPEYVKSAQYDPLTTPYSYQQLRSQRQKELYDDIYDGCFCLSDQPNEEFEGEYDLRPILLDSMDYSYMEVEEVLAAVLADHPEIFWMSMDFDIYDYKADNESEVVLHTDYKADEVITMMNQLNDSLKEIYSQLLPNLSPYEREVYVYSYIINTCVYDTAVEDSDEYSDSHPRLYNLCGVLVDKLAVCEGYARAFDYLCSSIGVDTVCITGIEEDDVDALHIWNAVLLDDEWYLCDATWDDWDEEEDVTDAYLYLNLDDATMSLDHTVDKTYAELSEDEYWELSSYINTFVPESCTATTYSYILRESVYLDSISVDRLCEGMVKAAENHRDSLMVCVDPEVYTPEQAAEKLFTGDQPYYQAMDLANTRLLGVQLDADSDAAYYEEDDRNLLVFELNYR